MQPDIGALIGTVTGSQSNAAIWISIMRTNSCSFGFPYIGPDIRPILRSDRKADRAAYTPSLCGAFCISDVCTIPVPKCRSDFHPECDPIFLAHGAANHGGSHISSVSRADVCSLQCWRY